MLHGIPCLSTLALVTALAVPAAAQAAEDTNIAQAARAGNTKQKTEVANVILASAAAEPAAGGMVANSNLKQTALFLMARGVARSGWGVLYAPAAPDNPAFRSQLSAALSTDPSSVPVDYFDARIATPLVEFMMEYAAVFTWVNFSYHDHELMGNRLADYVDVGGRVILGQWCLPTAGSYLGGRIMTAEYCPVTTGGTLPGGPYMGDGQDCVNEGITTYGGEGFLLLRPGPFVSDGTFEGGSLAVAWRVDRGVYYSPGNAGDTFGGGQWAELTANMVVCENELGDLNCDGLINVFDIDPFVLALTNPEAYAAEHPYCNYLLGDINGDGLVNAFDIDPFVQLLTGGA
jgi:hypothetical protein